MVKQDRMVVQGHILPACIHHFRSTIGAGSLIQQHIKWVQILFDPQQTKHLTGGNLLYGLSMSNTWANWTVVIFFFFWLPCAYHYQYPVLVSLTNARNGQWCIAVSSGSAADDRDIKCPNYWFQFSVLHNLSYPTAKTNLV